MMNIAKPFPSENGIYIGNIEEAITVEQLFFELRSHGTLQYLKLHRYCFFPYLNFYRYPFIGKSKNFSFAYFSNPEEARSAKKALNYKKVLRHPLRISTVDEYNNY